MLTVSGVLSRVSIHSALIREIMMSPGKFHRPSCRENSPDLKRLSYILLSYLLSPAFFQFPFPSKRSLLESKDVKILGNREKIFGSKVCSEPSLMAIYVKRGQVPQTPAILFNLLRNTMTLCEPSPASHSLWSALLLICVTDDLSFRS